MRTETHNYRDWMSILWVSEKYAKRLHAERSDETAYLLITPKIFSVKALQKTLYDKQNGFCTTLDMQ